CDAEGRVQLRAEDHALAGPPLEGRIHVHADDPGDHSEIDPDSPPPPAQALWTLWAAGELAGAELSPPESGRAVAHAILRALGRPVSEDMSPVPGTSHD
ncbi:MAG: hypothetical protein H0T76_18615, partial [Nannocystis sp.]